MKLRKGMVLVFSTNRPNETIVKASNNLITGEIETDKNRYSTDFINRWLRYGFCRAFAANKVPAELIK